jgi:ketosteroid isomerase-like protein
VHHRTVLATLAFVVISGCRTPGNIATGAETLLKRDRAWAALSDANGPVDSVVAYWTSDARVLLPGQPIVVGATAIREMVAGTRAIPGFHISWTPDSAVVTATGNLGYTYGTNRITAPDSSGVPRTVEGRYLTVWRREPDGLWHCVFDISNDGPQPISRTP